MKYARVLIEHCPNDATQLFIDYYTGNYRPRVEPIVLADHTVATAGGGLAAGAASAVQNLTNLLPLPYMHNSATASPGTQGNIKPPTVADAGVLVSPDDRPTPEYNAPAPRTAFSSFIDHPDEFIVFLEACLKEETLAQSDKTDLYTTLFEMYLHKASEKKGEAHREEWEAKAKALISGRDLPIENSNILLLSHLSKNNNDPKLVEDLFTNCADGINIIVASRFEETPVFFIDGIVRPIEAVGQLDLGFL